MRILEGGNAIGGEKIPRERVNPTIDAFEKEVLHLITVSRYGPIGSTGLKDFNGDIDLALESPQSLTEIDEILSSNGIRTAMSKGLGQVSCEFEQRNPDGSLTGIPAQIDLMVGDFDWLSFLYMGYDPTTTKYKPLTRTSILYGLLRIVAETINDDGSVSFYSISPNKGFFKKTGKVTEKKGFVSKRSDPANNGSPEELADLVGVSVSDLKLPFEGLWAVCQNTFPDDILQQLSDYVRGFARNQKLAVPSELMPEKLREASVAHMVHLEDLVYEGKSEKMLSYLKSMLSMLRGHSTEDRTTVKIDGSLMVAMANSFPGVDGPFVGMKNIFAKVPQIYQDDASIEAKYGHIPDLALKLKTALAYAPKLGIPDGEIWKGDFLFTKDDISVRKEEGKEFVVFKPNTLVYAVEKDSELGSKVLKSNIGIVFHTVHTGADVKSSERSVSYDVSVAKLNPPEDAFILDANLPSLAGRVFLTENESVNAEAEIQNIEETLSLISRKFPAILEPNSVQQGLLNKFENHAVRTSDKEDQFFGDPSEYIDKFVGWFSEKFDKESLTKKTEKGRISTIARKNALIEYFQNDEGFFNLVSVQQKVVHLKKLFSSKLEELGELTPYEELPDGSIKLTNHEGFAVSDIDGNIVKFVDRLGFSKANLLGHNIKESVSKNSFILKELKMRNLRKIEEILAVPGVADSTKKQTIKEATKKLKKGEVKGEDYEIAIVAGWYLNQGMSAEEIVGISSDIGVKPEKMSGILAMPSVVNTGRNISEKIKVPLNLVGTEACEVYGRTIQALSPEWTRYGASNATPKTDILIGGCRISLKMGLAQLMSGGKGETLATFHAALAKVPELKESPEVEDTLSLVQKFVTASRAPGPLSQVIKTGENKVVNDGNKVNKQAMASFEKLFNNSKIFKIAFVREAMSGETKFGADSPATAEWMLAADFEGDQVVIHSVFDDAYCAKIAESSKVSIRFKTSSVKKTVGGVKTKTGEYNFWSVVGLIANALRESGGAPRELIKDFFKKKMSSILKFFSFQPEIQVKDEIDFDV